MARKVKIALIYHYDENWIGGAYYIQNLISACGQLSEVLKPEFVVVTNSTERFDELKEITQYPYLTNADSFFNVILVKAVNKVYRMLKSQRIYSISRYKNADVVFPAGYEKVLYTHQAYLYWIPDFQEHYLTEFFTGEEVKKRKSFQAEILKKAKYIVFSSKATQRDFNEIYPGENVKQFVMPFAVTHRANTIATKQSLEKFKMPEAFFICSNQFWKHKNHTIIIKAIQLLKLRGVSVCVAFTGKENDYRNPDYFDSLMELINNYDIKDNVRFLGFISRADQLALLTEAVAIIQPSMFEGWSTIIEDGKALGQQIVASDLDVHKEQLANYPCKCFFHHQSSEELSLILEKLWSGRNTKRDKIHYNYKDNILKFAESFMEIVDVIRP